MSGTGGPRSDAPAVRTGRRGTNWRDWPQRASEPRTEPIISSLDLGATTVLRSSDVTIERERSRRRRTAALLLSIIGAILALDGCLALLAAHVVHVRGIHVPRYGLELIPAGGLVIAFMAVVAARR